MQLFTDPLLAEHASWATAYVTSGGADLGEIVAIADAAKDADDDAFFRAWSDAAQRHEDAAAAAATAGHASSAVAHYLRAAAFLTVAYHPLYGTPVDPRLRDAFDRQMVAFGQAMALRTSPAEPLRIPFEGHEMRGYFVPARNAAPGERRPLVIVTNGYDATIADTFLGSAAFIVERGYHCIVFDGPGQGELLVHHGVTMIPDWERVVAPVIDAALARPDVDPARVALYGWSLGGYLALRAAAGEHRLAACIADPALGGILAGLRAMASLVGMTPEEVAALPEISDANVAKLEPIITGDRALNWRFVKRGYWVNGATDLRSYLAAIAPFDMEGRYDAISCPVLGTQAEQDMLASGAGDVIARLGAKGTLVRFTAAEGAGDHCEFQNRALLNQRMLDWLDDTLR